VLSPTSVRNGIFEVPGKQYGFVGDNTNKGAQYIIDIDPNKKLPQNIRDEIQKAFDKFLVK
jgi:hypothetical protein